MLDEAKLKEVLSEAVNLRRVEPHIYSLFSTDAATGSYDKMFGSAYDRVACNRLYNRLVWGYATSEYHAHCIKVLRSSTKGWVLDAGCGSLAFTAKTYGNYSERPVLFLDRSLNLLKMAGSRLRKRNGRVPTNAVFLHADVLSVPFNSNCFGSVVSLNLLHVFEDDAAKRFLQEIRRTLMPGGTIFLTTLIENNRMADKYLHMWGRAGELVPRDDEGLMSLFEGLDLTVDHQIRGNLAFVLLKRP